MNAPVKWRSRDEVGARMYPLNPEWLAAYEEEVIDPALPIIDPHHHLWDRNGTRYLFDDLMDDTNSGHNIRQTVFIQCRSMYRAGGPVEMQPLGETEFVNGVAAMSDSGHYGDTRACNGIVSYADLRLGARVREVLNAHLIASSRFRGVRFSTPWDETEKLTPQHPPRYLMADKKWREGFAQLGPLGLTFDALLFHTQLGELLDLARAFPQTPIILDHVGCVIGTGPYAGKRDEIFAAWKKDIVELGRCQNVYVKLGGLGMHIFGFDFDKRPKPPSSEELATHWKPYIDTCIEAFGVKRSMFESNFPVDKISGSYRTYWNAFKRLASGASAEEKRELFHDAAARAYKLMTI